MLKESLQHTDRVSAEDISVEYISEDIADPLVYGSSERFEREKGDDSKDD